MANCIGQGFTSGAGWIPGLVDPLEMAGDDFACDRNLIHQEGLLTPQQFESMTPVLAIVREVGGLAHPSETGHPHGELGEKVLYPGALPVQDQRGIDDLSSPLPRSTVSMAGVIWGSIFRNSLASSSMVLVETICPTIPPLSVTPNSTSPPWLFSMAQRVFAASVR